MPDLGEEEPGAIADRRGHIVRKQAIEYVRRFEMMPVREVHPAQQQVGLVGMLAEAGLLLRGQQPYDRREVIFLVEIEQDFAVLGALDDDRVKPFRCRCGRLHCRSQGCAQCDDNADAQQQ